MRGSPILRPLAALLLLALAPLAAADDEAPTLAPLRPMDIFELEYASDPRISPDGRHVVYERTSMDVMKDRRRARLWIVDVDGGDHRPLTRSDAAESSPRWSPDGERVLYVASADDSSQLHVVWIETGQTARLTQLPKEPSGLSWSPDGRQIAFFMHVPDEAEPLAEMPTPPEGAEWAEPPRVIRAVDYRADGEGYLEEGHDQLFVLPAEGGTPRQVTHGPFRHDGTPSWAPDGRSIVFSGRRTPGWELDPVDSEVYRVDLASGDVVTLTDRRGPDDGPVVSPDGRHVAYLGFDDRLQSYQVTGLYVMDADGGNERRLGADLDRDVERPVWSADGRRILFQFDDEGDTRIGAMDLDGRWEVLDAAIGGTSLGRPYSSGSFTVAGDGTVAFTADSPHRPAEVAVTRPGEPPRALTRLNDDLLDHRALGEVEELWYHSSHDELPIQGWIVKPPGFDPNRRYPLLLEIHGGPFAAYGPHFASEIQLFAAAGYVVLYTNPRGSTGYGEEFGNLIHHAYPGQDYDDLMSGVDAVIARGYVDENALFVTGGSGGGVLTSWIVGKTDRFAAAVVAKPVINWTSFVGTSDGYSYYHKYWFPTYPWEDPDHYWRRSPLSLVGNVTTPTMLLTGEEDLRTPIAESEQYYQALKLRGIDTALVRIPGASHGIAARPSQLIAKVVHILRWFELQRVDS